MAKKKDKDCQQDVNSLASCTPRKRIAILSKKFMLCRAYPTRPEIGGHKCYQKDTIVRDQGLIDELLSKGAPLEVYYQDVDGTTKD